MTNQTILEIVEKIHQATGDLVTVYAPDDTMISEKGISHSSKMRTILKALGDIEEQEAFDGKIYVRVPGQGRSAYYVVAADTKVGITVAKLAAVMIAKVVETENAVYDNDRFFKDILLDNLLIVDIYNQANHLHLEINQRRVVYIVELKEREATASAVAILQSMFAADENYYIIPIDEKSIAIVHQLTPKENDRSIRKIADTVFDTLSTELMESIHIAYGSVADEIRRVANSYKEARIALTVARIFNPEQTVIAYSSLGIGRLIYQLPIPMCKMFIEEIFKGYGPDNFSEDTLTTVNAFFANDLNVSKTADALYIHRNTLVYRLNKLQENTGLDLRSFEDAITFKIALMVVKHMHYMENQAL